jgi:hypothetical protein
MNLEAFKSKLASLTPLGFTVCFHSTAVFPTPSATSNKGMRCETIHINYEFIKIFVI